MFSRRLAEYLIKRKDVSIFQVYNFFSVSGGNLFAGRFVIRHSFCPFGSNHHKTQCQFLHKYKIGGILLWIIPFILCFRINIGNCFIKSTISWKWISFDHTAPVQNLLLHGSGNSFHHVGSVPSADNFHSHGL